MADDSPRITLEKLTATRVARIIINRPEKHNAIDQRMIDEWMAALEEVRGDDAIRVVITKGNGKSFGSGLDLNYLRSAAISNRADWERSSAPRALADCIREYPKVTISQVHGHCLGHAMVIMCSHDLAYIADTAQVGMPEIIRGSFGQMATANLFHSGVPLKKAAVIQLTGRNISGEQADRLGLVSGVLPEGELESHVMSIAEEIATRNPAALASAKIAVRMGGKLAVADAMQMDQLVGAWMRMSIDANAFGEK